MGARTVICKEACGQAINPIFGRRSGRTIRVKSSNNARHRRALGERMATLPSFYWWRQTFVPKRRLHRAHSGSLWPSIRSAPCLRYVDVTLGAAKNFRTAVRSRIRSAVRVSALAVPVLCLVVDKPFDVYAWIADHPYARE